MLKFKKNRSKNKALKKTSKPKLNIGRFICVSCKKVKHKINRVLNDAKVKLQDIPQANFDLGKYHMVNGNIKDAIFRFKLVSMLRPDNMKAFYYLGRSHILDGNNKKAQKAFDKLAEQGVLAQEVEYFLNRFERPDDIKAIPESMIDEICNVYFGYYRKDYLNNGYVGHQILVNELFNYLDMQNNRLNILDLGCGYGQCGLLFKESSLNNKITGIDLSKFAIKKTSAVTFQNSNVYADVQNIEITQFLSNNTEKFDVIIADRSVNLIGDLENFANLVKRNLNENGKFAVVFDEMELNDFGEDLNYESNDGDLGSNEEHEAVSNANISSAFFPVEQEFLFSDDFIIKTFTKKGFELKLHKKINVIENIGAGLYIFSL